MYDADGALLLQKDPGTLWVYAAGSASRNRVYPWSLRCCQQDLDPFGAKYLVERCGELRVAVTNQELEACGCQISCHRV
jgi:hypothetical protein